MRHLNLKPNTSFEAMRKKYKTMAMQQHPNKVAGRLRAQGGSAAAINAARAKATANFQKLEQAHSSATAHFTKYQSFRAPPPGPQRPTTPPPQQAPPRAAPQRAAPRAAGRSAFGRMYGRMYDRARASFQGAKPVFARARASFQSMKPMFARAARASFQGARASFQGARASFSQAKPMFSRGRPDNPDSRSVKLYIAFSQASGTPNVHVPATAPGMVAYVTHMSNELIVMLYSQGRIAVVAHMALVNRRLGPIRVQRYGPAYANVSFLEQARELFNRRGGRY